jgi:hypothetical protein
LKIAEFHHNMERPKEKNWKWRGSFGFGWICYHFAAVIFVSSVHYLFCHDFRGDSFMETSPNTEVAYGGFGATFACDAAA